MKRRAIISVSDRSGAVELARELNELGWEVLSTGGTARLLREAGVRVRDVAEVTGHPEVLEGRVKTLHPAIHAGILARAGHEEDAEALRSLGYAPVALVAVNLYPFRDTVARGAELAEAMEQVDIGGPTMLRAAAKNHTAVWAVVDPADYGRVLEVLRSESDAADLRRELARKVFAHTAMYDAAIADYLTGRGDGAAQTLPDQLSVRLRKVQGLRYGENPHQAAAFFAPEGERRGLTTLEQLQGKELSFNNLLDVDAALLGTSAWTAEDPVCVIIKHTTPCGVALGNDAEDAYRRALATDPVSAFGGVIGFNVAVSEAAAEAVAAQFVEVIVAPAFHPGALGILASKKNVRVLVGGGGPASAQEWDWKGVCGGVLIQERLRMSFPEEGWRVATRREPTPEEWRDLRFAWRVAALVKSNAIVLARDGRTLGIGAGQMSRVDSSRVAVMKAGDHGLELAGCVVASDAFFPFRDGVDAAARAGARAVIQPGGSLRDAEVIAAADEHDLAMVFTAQRVFRH